MIRGFFGALAAIVALVLLVSLGVLNTATRTEVHCGPWTTTPPIERYLDVGANLGRIVHDLSEGKYTPELVVKKVKDTFSLVGLFKQVYKLTALGKTEPEAATGWRNASREAQEKALASCCPVSVDPNQDNNGNPPTDAQPFDPRTLAFRTGLTGAPLAADALRQAGFPNAEIPMGVAVARYESTFDPRATNGSHVGLWQISDDNARRLNLGDRNDPYVNARYAHALWQGRGGSWAEDWSVYDTARSHVSEYARYAVGLDPQSNGQQQATGCQQTGTGNLTGTIAQVATLNPTGSGNWQSVVQVGPYWYVSHATAGDRTQIIHRLGSDGRELDQMTLYGFTHLQGFAVVGTTVYAPLRNYQVVTFPYRPGGSTHGGQPTPWRGHISKDPTANRVVIRAGNRYQAYDLTTRQPVGVPVRTDPGSRQGHSISGSTVYILTGTTNQAARVDAYSITTGQQTGTRDITSLGANVAGSHREPEGMFGSMVGVKVNTGERRRLLIFTLGGTTSSGPSSYDRINPRTVAQAIAYMQPGRTVRPNTCAHEVAVAYGWPNSGAPTAVALWRSIPASQRHTDGSIPPRGALVFWTTGHPAGHVAISLGGGQIVSTDVPRGRIGVGPITKFDHWGARLGWTPPTFPAKGTRA